ncbi:MAG TPA: TonB-dependent siderophore receptor [Gemmatimonadaceae bacterium]
MHISAIFLAVRFLALPQVVVDTAAVHHFEWQARPLVEALGDFSRETGVVVDADRKLIAQIVAPALSGDFSAADALRRLVAGSGLIVRFTSTGSASLERKDRSRPQTLAAMRVSAPRVQQGYTGIRTSTAMRTDTPLRDTPQSVSVVTHELIADQSMQSMADVVRYVPGVSMAQGEGHRDAPTIRGNNTTADFFLDGIRDDAQYLRDLYNVERVEVLKGPDAMIFGRGGGGGVINRVTRQAEWSPARTLTVESGAYEHNRGVIDLGQGLNQHVAGRVVGMFEHSGGFRDDASLTRYGVDPTLAFAAGDNTVVRLGYEHFDDERRVDRGIPSYRGRPSDVDIATFFGNPTVNRATSRVNVGSAAIEHHLPGGLTLRNRTTYGDYDIFYQNTYPGAVNATGTNVTLSAYNHAIPRRNFLNVADATYAMSTGALRHTLLAGADYSRQRSDQVRRTGYYDDTTAAYSAPLSDPTVSTPVVFRPSATDADNSMSTHDAAAYVQDQIALTSAWQGVVGVRVERFATSYDNNRTGLHLDRADRLVSPRAGIVYEPNEAVSFYGSYGVSYLPSSGDQFTTLTVTTATLEPERFTNRELGVKWDVRPALNLTTALYRLDRTNTAAPDPNNAGLTVQTGATRTTGWELGANGELSRHWQLSAGVATQRATILGTTNAAHAGATVALVPHAAASLWNRYQVTRSLGVGLGVIHQTDAYAAVDNTVTLPGFTRVDAALYVTLRADLRAQVNVENLLDTRYYPTSQGNNNIMPGAPRTLRVSMVAGR